MMGRKLGVTQVRRVKLVTRELSVADAVSEACGDLSTLGEELREWYDNMPESIQGSRDDVSEAADALENLSEPDVPEELGKLMFEFSLPKAPKRRSRSDRRDDAMLLAGFLIEELEKVEADADREKSMKEEAQTLREELEQFKDEAEGIDFPGRNA